MSLAPSSYKYIIHDKPKNHKTWAVHSTKAYYIGPALNYYQCYEVHIQKTLTKRIADAITFLPHNIEIPETISKTVAIAKINDLI